MSAAAAIVLAALLGSPAAAPTPAAAPARALPAVVTVCVDRGTRRCWSAAGADDPCAGGEVFGRAAANQAPGGLLTDCWRELDR